jgi:Kef-type K+ transport system membrane component KefB
MSWFVPDSLTRFLVQVIVILAAARALGVLARWVGQPVVIAEIAAGVLLGPSFLGWVAPDVTATLFAPESLGVLRSLSQLGHILFMFLVGLELDLGLLRGRRRASLVISQTSIVVPFALGIALAFWLRPRFGDPGTPMAAFVLFMGSAMSITAFPVLARILAESGLRQTRVGALATACAAVDDVTAWCLLAFAVSVARHAGIEDGLRTTGLAAVYVALMFTAARWLLARGFARPAASGAVSQNQLALMLGLLMVSAWASERIGIHALFGAFLFGVVLPKGEGFVHAVVARLEDVVLIVFLPLFFALSGLRTHLDMLGSASSLLACAAIIVAATAGKIGGGAVAARWTGLPWREATVLGILLNTRGLMELIVLNIGLELGVITPAIFSMMVIMALVTTLMAMPLLRRFHLPAE